MRRKKYLVVTKKTKALNERLFKAIKNGDLDTVMKCLQKGADIKAKGCYTFDAWLSLYGASMYGPLGTAIEHKQPHIAKFLIEAGTNIDFENRFACYIPLHVAIIYGYDDLVEAIIKAGTSVNIRDGYNWTPLHWAVYHKRINIAHHLIKIGAKIDAKDEYDETPLHIATKYKNHEMAILLIESGADLFMKNNIGQTPFDFIKDEKWKTKIMAAYSEYQSRVALGKIETSNCNNVEPKMARKVKAV